MPEALRREDGATAIIVAICLLLLFGAGALAIDLGSAYETKRTLVVDTDAAALAGARALSTPDGDCAAAEDAAADFLSVNLGSPVTVAQLKATEGAALTCSEADGTVTVAWTGQAQQTLSGAIGSGQLDVRSSSTARSVPGVDAGLVRPLMVCSNSPLVQHFYDSNEPLLDVLYSGSGPCMGSGNTGYICFDTNCASGGKDEDIPNLIRNGWDGEITLGAPPDVNAEDQGCPSNDDSSHDPPWCRNGPGHRTSLTTDWGDLVADCTSMDDPDCPVFSLVVINENTNGRDDVQPTGFLYVKLYGACEKKKGGGLRPEDDICDNGSLNLRLDVLGLQTSGLPDGSGVLTPSRTYLCAGDGGGVCE